MMSLGGMASASKEYCYTETKQNGTNSRSSIELIDERRIGGTHGERGKSYEKAEI